MGAPVVHFEIGCRSKETVEFYRKLLGWTTEPFGDSTDMVNTGNPMGVGGHFTRLGHEPHNYCLVYAAVEDIRAEVKRAEELGGTLCVPPTEVPGMGYFAWIKDPEGTVFGLWQSLMK